MDSREEGGFFVLAHIAHQLFAERISRSSAASLRIFGLFCNDFGGLLAQQTLTTLLLALASPPAAPPPLLCFFDIRTLFLSTGDSGRKRTTSPLSFVPLAA